jgi:hypothetical protein
MGQTRAEIIETMKSDIEFRIAESLGLDEPDEGTAEYESRQAKLAPVAAIKTIADVITYVNNSGWVIEDFFLSGGYEIITAGMSPKKVPPEVFKEGGELVAEQQWSGGSWVHVYLFDGTYFIVNEVETSFADTEDEALEMAGIADDTHDQITHAHVHSMMAASAEQPATENTGAPSSTQLTELLKVSTKDQRLRLILDDVKQMPPQRRFSSIEPMKLAEALFDDYPSFWGSSNQAGHCEEDIENGLGWLQLSHDVTNDANDFEIHWEACQGCAGEIFNLRGPYEIYDRDSESPYRAEPPTDDVTFAAENVISEACWHTAKSEGQIELFAEVLGVCHLTKERSEELIPKNDDFPDQEIDVVELRWRSWTHSGDFDPNVFLDLESSFTSARIEKQMLLNPEFLHDGLGVEKAYIDYSSQSEDIQTVPEEVLNALCDHLRDQWEDELIEHADIDQDFLAEWPLKLRSTAQSMINR